MRVDTGRRGYNGIMMGINQALDQLRLDRTFMENVAAWEILPARPASYANFPSKLAPMLIGALEKLGTTPLYVHQAQAVELALDRKNTVVVTGTASGKTLCYNLPVIQHLMEDPDARALYLFPTKALAQDQAEALSGLLDTMQAADRIPVRTYDGDTPRSQRPSVRSDARVIITNPDMLHAGIIPHHPRWSALFENLRWVIVDELHTYRGVFGSNVANLFRRLRRICSFYGSDPRFIMTSATIANPKELAERLIEAPVQLVPPDLDGSPRAEKHIILYNPPVIDRRLGIRRAYTLEATRIAKTFLLAEVQTAVFARARRTTEILLGYIRDGFQEDGGDSSRIRGYRGGYLPLERREIEYGLREGRVLGVVATNALELGVDIGQLGAAVLVGYPGSIASLWQQAGRAGRRNERSAAVLVASAAPLDQFVAYHPHYVFEHAPEMGLINPDNLAILLRHLQCAAFELPFRKGEKFGESEDVPELLDFLAEEGELHASNDTYHWIADTYPAQGVSLRSGDESTVVIQDSSTGRPNVIGEVDRSTAPILIHEGAVYTHEGRTFLVQQLQWEAGIASVEPADVDYYTIAAETFDLSVNQVHEAREQDHARCAHGSVQITSQATSYRKVKRYTHETLGYGSIDLPAKQYDTSAYWLWFSPEIVKKMEQEGVLLAPNDYGPSWLEARQRARERDGYICRQCGAVESNSHPHHVHHLRPFREYGYIAGENRNDRDANELDNLITLCSACHHRAESSRGRRSALGGLAYTLGNIAPLYLMCDPRDIGVVKEVRSKSTGGPTITLYDRIPDGMGLSERLYDLHEGLLKASQDLIKHCACLDGCPACVGPVGEAGSAVKEATQRLLEMLLG